MKITKDTLVAEALESSDKANEILMDYVGVACVGCGGRFFETLEMALESHGAGKKLDQVVKDLNEAASSPKKKETPKK